jgi:Zn-dependent protease with chaperone function
MINVKACVTTKEKVYLTICFIIGALVWIGVLVPPLLILTHPLFPARIAFLPLTILLAFFIIYRLILQEFFKAHIFGNSVRVSEMQFSEVYKIALEMAKKMGVGQMPLIFIINEEGRMNALALRFIGHSYVILYASLVDLMLKRNAVKELRMILAHELAHHALGHINFWKNVIIAPAKIVPFLGNAYNRACELSADRLGMVVTGELAPSQRALIALACGSEALSNKINIMSFMDQEVEFLLFFGFLREIFASHPRTTKRVIWLENFGRSANLYASDAHAEAVGGWRVYGISGPLSGKAIELTRAPLVIGRDPHDAHLIVPGNSGVISRRHCIVRFGGDGTTIFLEDAGSKNGTFLNNGRRLEPGMPQPLESGDRFYLAQPDIAFELQRR